MASAGRSGALQRAGLSWRTTPSGGHRGGIHGGEVDDGSDSGVAGPGGASPASTVVVVPRPHPTMAVVSIAKSKRASRCELLVMVVSTNRAHRRAWPRAIPSQRRAGDRGHRRSGHGMHARCPRSYRPGDLGNRCLWHRHLRRSRRRNPSPEVAPDGRPGSRSRVVRRSRRPRGNWPGRTRRRAQGHGPAFRRSPDRRSKPHRGHNRRRWNNRACRRTRTSRDP